VLRFIRFPGLFGLVAFSIPAHHGHGCGSRRVGRLQTQQATGGIRTAGHLEFQTSQRLSVPRAAIRYLEHKEKGRHRPEVDTAISAIYARFPDMPLESQEAFGEHFTSLSL
jgi:hypothetical protein